ncbi:MAG: very short patch repair endonuclease [Promethearchaeota archaeon Loki_b32]|nr:MAG: very short patch repair endonuclease [Candidatus Lokiarchaeota archaeon Loki_b32]
MVDTLTKKQRSYCMSRIRGKWTFPERKIHNFLKGWKVKHNMHPKTRGSPDIILTDKKIAIFVHGCFWHKCPRCFKKPKSKKTYWLPKLEKNIKRDRLNTNILKRNGWRVVKFWEHQIKKDFKRNFYKII